MTDSQQDIIQQIQHPNKRAMIEALEKSLGIVTTAAKAAGIERTSHYLWMQDDPDYKTAVEAVNEMAIDFAESQLNQLMQGARHEVVTNKGEVVTVKDAPNPASVIFYLKTKGKKRGYIERTELDVRVQEVDPFPGIDLSVPNEKTDKSQQTD